MGRGKSKNVEEKVIDAIIRVSQNNVGWSSTKVRNHLLMKYDKYGLKKEDIPAKRTVQKYLAKYGPKIKKAQENDLERPWDLSLLRAYEISPDVAPMVLEIQKELIQEKLERLNIRQVLWASKLYPLIIKLQGQNEHLKFILHYWCTMYAAFESFNEVKGTHSDNSMTDKYFFESLSDHTKNPNYDVNCYKRIWIFQNPTPLTPEQKIIRDIIKDGLRAIAKDPKAAFPPEISPEAKALAAKIKINSATRSTPGWKIIIDTTKDGAKQVAKDAAKTATDIINPEAKRL